MRGVLTIFISLILFSMLISSSFVLAQYSDSSTSKDIQERPNVRSTDKVEKNSDQTYTATRERFAKRIKIRDGKEIETDLRIEEDGSDFSVIDSEGRKHKVKVSPEKLRRMILARLKASNITDYSIEEREETDRNIPRVVYKIRSEHPGRFLGIFKIGMRAETQVDSETGEVLDVRTPWWAFLVAGKDVPEENIIGNETIQSEIVSTDSELDEEFSEIEVE